MEKSINKSVFVIPAVYIILGLVMVIFPETTMRTFCLSLGAIAAVLGIVNLVSYFSRNAVDFVYRYDFVNGVLLILLGLLFIVKMDLIIELIPIMLGIMILANGIMKLQHAIDLKRINFSGWLYVLVFSLLCLSVGAVCVFQPAFIASTLVILMGISFLFCGLTDFITLFFLSKRLKEYIAEESGNIEEYINAKEAGDVTGKRKAKKAEKSDSKYNTDVYAVQASEPEAINTEAPGPEVNNAGIINTEEDVVKTAEDVKDAEYIPAAEVYIAEDKVQEMEEAAQEVKNEVSGEVQAIDKDAGSPDAVSDVTEQTETAFISSDMQEDSGSSVTGSDTEGESESAVIGSDLEEKPELTGFDSKKEEAEGVARAVEEGSESTDSAADAEEAVLAGISADIGAEVAKIKEDEAEEGTVKEINSDPNQEKNKFGIKSIFKKKNRD